MKKVQLSDRLRAVASLVSEGSRIADVGCDHGYIPVSLYQEGKISSAIAMDVNEGPLLRAREHIQEYGLGNYISTRLSDGVRNLMAGEADTVIIAGMGGPLMEKIIAEGEEVLVGIAELILQPQSEIGHFRKFLHASGYAVVQEDMILEDGKYYPMMKAVHGVQRYEREIEYLYGKGLLDMKHPVLKQFLLKEQSTVLRILNHLEETGTSAAKARQKQLREELNYIEEALRAYEV